MRFSWLRVPFAAFAMLFLTSCNHHSDPTGPSAEYVHVFIQNDSTASIWAPISFAVTPDNSANQLLPGGRAEYIGVSANSWGGGFAVARPSWQNLATVNYSFAQPPASKAGLQVVTVHITANPSAPVTATSDRPDLVSIKSVDQN
jgi:hypothetical protein